MESTKVDWASHVKAWQLSGLSQQGYGRVHGISAKSLSRHVCKAALGAVPAKGLPVHLVGVKVQGGCAVGVAGDHGASSLVLRHASGWVVDWPLNLRAEVLAWAQSL
jgi:hypothetical protein